MSPGIFDAQFNKAIKGGVEKGEFTQPKGMFRSSFTRIALFYLRCFPIPALCAVLDIV
jgi:hypothetical protein